ncbi:unnamed protein product [Ranitomeya imitator]|uniref:Uncharacterized protein n=1 Tax=Ranitomeya imitator TaxID=111125 RepID=A0ABN9L427_9NEOB|nr:unnamed protein product [Ranitomeya imitator]
MLLTSLAGAQKREVPPRDCDDYWDEWKYCKSLKNRFHYYYTHGGKPAASSGKWTTRPVGNGRRRGVKQPRSGTGEALVQSETARQKERLNNNPVWTIRKRPPVDWHVPLDRDKPQQEDSWN